MPRPAAPAHRACRPIAPDAPDLARRERAGPAKKLPPLLFYCQHSLGIGHLTRSFALARALSKSFRVVFLNGGPMPPGVPVPPVTVIVDLPPLGLDDGHNVVGRGAVVDVAAAREQRRQMIDDAVAATRPAVVLVELFPFGRKKFAGEILAMVRAARRQSGGAARIVCSLRDILVDARRDQQHHDDRARWLADRYFDAILVHSDPSFARLDASFRPSRPLGVPVHYTGYVVPARTGSDASVKRDRILVSAGGGIVGYPLFAAALEAQALLWPQLGLPMRIIAGPFLPEREWAALQRTAAGRPDVELMRHVPDMVAEMRSARVSVSQFGYNTALDIIVAGAPALVVPYAERGENEQMRRAEALAALGVVRHLAAPRPDATALAAGIVGTLGFTPAAAPLSLAGAETSAALLGAMTLARNRSLTRGAGDA